MSEKISDVFGEVIHHTSRLGLIENGDLVDVSVIAYEAGMRFPTAISRAAWEECVAWTVDDSDRQVVQDEKGRLWDVLWMLRCAIRGQVAPVEKVDESTLLFKLDRVPRDGKSTAAREFVLKGVCGPGDTAAPVFTILLPDED